MQKTILIDGKKMNAKATAIIPRSYRFHFHRDIIQDMKRLDDAMKKAKKEHREFSALDLTIFENVAWLFFMQGGEDVGESPEQWLDSLDGMFSVYEVLPQLLDLWKCNLATTAKPKKKFK